MDQVDRPDVRRGIGLPAATWILFDFAYTLFAFVVFARYLGDWLIIDLDRPDWYYASAQGIAALCLVVLMPLAGVMADVIGRHVPLLAIFSVTAAGAAVAIGLVPVGDSVLPILALGVVCAVATALALAQFDPLLGSVAPRERWGAISGAGVAAGFVGILVALWAFGAWVGEGDKQRAFAPAGAALLVLGMPAFVAIRERRRRAGWLDEAAIGGRGPVRIAAGRVFGAVRELRQHPDVLRLLLGRFLYTDAVSTLNVYLVVYMSRVGSFDERQKDLALVLGVSFAALGGGASALWVRRHGPRATLLAVLPTFAAGISVVALLGTAWSIWVLAPLVGIALGTIYTADRVFMLNLVPATQRGELFGFFNLVGRVGQALGPLVLWGGTIALLTNVVGMTDLDASRVSLLLLGLATLLGLLVIRPLDDRHGRGDAGEASALAAAPGDGDPGSARPPAAPGSP